MEGCSQILYQPTLFDPEEDKMAACCIDAAVDAGIKQFVMLSVLHPGMSTLLQHTMKQKAEEYLIYKGLSDELNYTILEPTHYMHNFSIPVVNEAGCYKIFYDPSTRLSLVDAEDVGAAAAKVLTEDGHQNATYELVGTDYISSDEMVDIYNKITGYNIKAVYESDPNTAMKMFSTTDWNGYPGEVFRHLSYTYSTFGLAGNANVLTWLIGRKPHTFEEFVRREIQKIS